MFPCRSHPGYSGHAAVVQLGLQVVRVLGMQNGNVVVAGALVRPYDTAGDAIAADDRCRARSKPRTRVLDFGVNATLPFAMACEFM